MKEVQRTVALCASMDLAKGLEKSGHLWDC